MSDGLPNPSAESASGATRPELVAVNSIAEAGAADTGGTTPPSRPWWVDRRVRSLAVGLVAAGLLAVLLFGVIGTGSGSSPEQVVPIGGFAPDFTLPSLTGGAPVHLAALGRDRHRPVVLNFFASWCVPCQEETPLLAGVASHERRAGSSVQFVGVDVSDLPSKATAFVQQAGVSYPVAVDNDLTVTSGKYGLNAEPQTFFIDAKGRVVAHKLGALDRGELEADLQQLSNG